MVLFISIQNKIDAIRAIITAYMIFQGKLFCKVNEAIESDMMTQRKEINFFDHLSITEAMDFSEEDQKEQHDEDDSNTVSKDNFFIEDYES